MMQAPRGSRATSSSASSMLGWLATMISAGFVAQGVEAAASMRIMPAAALRPETR